MLPLATGMATQLAKSAQLIEWWEEFISKPFDIYKLILDFGRMSSYDPT